jgi:cytochrome c oxidase subunit IV
MQNYKKHKLQLYKGIYVDIPSASNFKPSSIASNSVHYSGFLVGYMAWGFVICFHLILLILMGIRVLSLQIRHFEIALSIIVPILVIYLLKMLSMTSAGKFLFIQKVTDRLNSRSRKTYAIFVYFNFFAGKI